MPTAKKKTTKKSAGPIELPKNQERHYGPKSFTCCVDRKTAADLISKHGFFMKKDGGKEVHLWADTQAYESYKGAK